MNDTPRPAARKEPWVPLGVSLAILLSLTLTLVDRHHAKAQVPYEVKPAASVVATAPVPGPDNTNENMGCGEVEACYAMNPQSR